MKRKSPDQESSQQTEGKLQEEQSFLAQIEDHLAEHFAVLPVLSQMRTTNERAVKLTALCDDLLKRYTYYLFPTEYWLKVSLGNEDEEVRIQQNQVLLHAQLWMPTAQHGSLMVLVQLDLTPEDNDLENVMLTFRAELAVPGKNIGVPAPGTEKYWANLDQPAR